MVPGLLQADDAPSSSLGFAEPSSLMSPTSKPSAGTYVDAHMQPQRAEWRLRGVARNLRSIVAVRDSKAPCRGPGPGPWTVRLTWRLTGQRSGP
jgi:hypothetical protein